MQNDFIDGNLAVANAKEIIDPMSHMLKDPVWNQIIFSKDWHPRDHISFLSNINLRELDPDWLAEHPGEVEMFQEVVFKRDPPYHQIMWPDHCVQESRGSEIVESLLVPENSRLIKKGKDPEIDSYSAFFDNTGIQGAGSTGLDEMIQQSTEVVVVGLALDYCVGSTSLDALKLKFPTTILKDMTKPVDTLTGEAMILDVEMAGGQVMTFQEWKEAQGSWDQAKKLSDILLRE